MVPMTPFATLFDSDSSDEVDVVGLGQPQPGAAFHSGFRGLWVAWRQPLDVEQRRRLRQMIGALPAGKSARCHMPAFGLQIGAAPSPVHVSICFTCNNAYVDGDLRAFAGQSPAARDLLAFLRSFAPPEWTPPTHSKDA
jgi:hypothetical protein